MVPSSQGATATSLDDCFSFLIDIAPGEMGLGRVVMVLEQLG